MHVVRTVEGLRGPHLFKKNAEASERNYQNNNNDDHDDYEDRRIIKSPHVPEVNRRLTGGFSKIGIWADRYCMHLFRFCFIVVEANSIFI